jgi:hypothetical protein
VLTYRVGSHDRPRGHAFLFFRDGDAPNVIWATYLIVPPISLDLGKYVPAAFAAQVSAQLANQGTMAQPLPPLPEKFADGIEGLERLAELRGDDVLDGGTVRASDPFQVMQPVADVGREYAEGYQAYVDRAPLGTTVESATSESDSSSSVDVDEILLQVMPDRDKIERLARLVGTMRYALGGGDAALLQETADDMERVGRRLGDKYRVPELIAAARLAGPRGGDLAQLYVERCYKLVDEDYAAVPAIEQRIAALNAQPAE